MAQSKSYFHDINNKLTVVRGNSDLLLMLLAKDRWTKEIAQEKLAAIRQAADELSALAKELRSLLEGDVT